MRSVESGRGDGFLWEDVVYHEPAGISLLARLYRPPNPGPWPAIIDVHGGRWCSESRLTNSSIDEALVRAGLFVMALDFRMPPVARFPAPVADINFAIRWLRAQASQYSIRPDCIGALGTSSGGHQLLLNVLQPDSFTMEHTAEVARVPAALNCAVFCWPVTDPPARYAYARERGMGGHIDCHNAYWGDLAAMRRGSPQRMLEERDFDCLVPAQMIQGDADVILAPGMSERFVAAWRAASGEIDFHCFPGQGHTFITKDPAAAASRDAVSRIIDFVLRHS